MKILGRFIDALRVFWWFWKNPQTVQASNFKMLSDLLTLILKVAEENRAYMCHVAYIHPTEGEKNIVSIWAGAGSNASPLKRISDLLEENNTLRTQISDLIHKTA